MGKRRGQGEGSIYKMADGRWRGAVSLGWKKDVAGKVAWKRKVITASTRGEVQDQLKRTLRDQQMGLPVGPDHTTVAGFLTNWLDTIAAPTVRPKTLRTYRDLIRLHISPSIGDLHLAKLTPQDVRGFLNEKSTAVQPPRSKQEGAVGKPLSSRTVKHLLVTLKGALETAVKDGLVPRNVAALVDPPRSVKRDPQTFTPDQARAFIKAVKGDRLEALFTVAASIALRQGEILGLMLSDVDLEAGTVSVNGALQRVNKKLLRVETKTESSNRTISLPAVAVSALANHAQTRESERQFAGERWQESGYFFTSTVGTPLDARSVIRRFHAILQAAELPKLRFHDLRHSAATLLLAQGVSPRYITDLLGHTQVSFTMQTYAHVLSPARKEVANKMDEILGEQAEKNPVATNFATKHEKIESGKSLN